MFGEELMKSVLLREQTLYFLIFSPSNLDLGGSDFKHNPKLGLL